MMRVISKILRLLLKTLERFESQSMSAELWRWSINWSMYEMFDEVQKGIRKFEAQ